MNSILLLMIPAFLLASYVGDLSCKTCHKQEHQLWQDSHHDLAMQIASEKSVLGDFDKAAFTSKAGITTTFFKKDKAFMVRTDGPDGKLHDYEISYVFGLYPLQQYMLNFADGKIQVLDIAWDSRSKEEGGQRWYHLHPHERILAGDVLHWSGPNMNWNYMCAECHSTNLQKNYDAKSRTYHTSYDAINVSCEACHGEGSLHVSWANDPKSYKGTLKKGLRIDLSAFSQKRWQINPKSGKPERLGAINRSEVELCAQCHSRRSQLDEDFKPGARFEDHHLPVTLSDTLYFSDGKIKDEVYVYGSFVQSKMYEKGVTCSDCHNSHSLDRHAVGDQVCNQCHRRVDYEEKKHHFHKSSSVSCIDCHMPSRTYMGVDERNDHSFRVPRPDLSIDSDIPNACNNCHTDKDAKWASDAMKRWYAKTPIGKQNFSHQIHALQINSDKAQQSLYEILMSDAPNIAKATAVEYLGSHPTQQSYMTTLQMLRNSDAQIRRSALIALESFPPKFRVEKTFEMLDDKAKIVRIEAARQLSVFAQGELEMIKRSKLEKGIKEYKKTLLFNADRAESQTALGSLYVNLKAYDKAEMAYQEALFLQPKYIPAYVNYVHLLQGKGEEKKALELIEKGLDEVSDSADLYHVLGLWHVRHKNATKGLEALKKAAELEVENSRFQYVYAVALAEKDISLAIKVLEDSLRRHSGDMQTLSALVYYTKQAGLSEKTKEYQSRVEKLMQFTPKIN